jgi:endo-1,4-beta-xylanase
MFETRHGHWWRGNVYWPAFSGGQCVMSRWNLFVVAAFLGTTAATVYGDLPSLKDTYANDFLIGACIATPVDQAYPPQEVELISRQFNQATPENCMKPEDVQPKEHTFTFDQADGFVTFCQAHHIVIHGHTLVWHSQTPAWFFRDGDHAASRDLLLARLRAHILAEVGRYKGRVRSWDVVNEAIDEGGGARLYRNSKWHKIIGDDFIEQAFRFAHEADPDAELQYNDFNIESGRKFQKALTMLKGLKEKGVPINSVGIQGHWIINRIPYDELEHAIVEFNKLGLKVNITELDIDALGRTYRGADINGGGGERAAARPATRPAINLPEVLAREADQYAKLFAIFHKHRDAIEYVTVWGVDDGHSWLNFFGGRRKNYPVLFDRALQPKPAFFSVINVVAQGTNAGN